ncbi:hypothetical protein WN944_022149 [Citrus x changshan-huyou]|uniref:Uncharacterized protein n=1 Tax=Citrus x changshan-huyou TaxID=2935761 RepID=A0AAP0N2Z3_9ROSI
MLLCPGILLKFFLDKAKWQISKLVFQRKERKKMERRKNLRLLIVWLVIMGLLSVLTGHSTASLKGWEICEGTCYIDCLCVSHQVPGYFCHYFCSAKCAKCIFKHCRPIPLPPQSKWKCRAP